MKNSVQKKDRGNLKSKLTKSVTNAIKKFENSNKATELVEKDAGHFAFNSIPNSYFQQSDPEIERLGRERSNLRIQMKLYLIFFLLLQSCTTPKSKTANQPDQSEQSEQYFDIEQSVVSDNTSLFTATQKDQLTERLIAYDRETMR